MVLAFDQTLANSPLPLRGTSRDKIIVRPQFEEDEKELEQTRSNSKPSPKSAVNTKLDKSASNISGQLATNLMESSTNLRSPQDRAMNDDAAAFEENNHEDSCMPNAATFDSPQHYRQRVLALG